VELEPAEELLYQYLHQNGRNLLDTIAMECHMPVFEAASVLLSLEMKGVIKPLPGKLFEAV
jgi:DNA processing protein